MPIILHEHSVANKLYYWMEDDGVGDDDSDVMCVLAKYRGDGHWLE